VLSASGVTITTLQLIVIACVPLNSLEGSILISVQHLSTGLVVAFCMTAFYSVMHAHTYTQTYTYTVLLLYSILAVLFLLFTVGAIFLFDCNLISLLASCFIHYFSSRLSLLLISNEMNIKWY
jgi:hypothetical protein